MLALLCAVLSLHSASAVTWVGLTGDRNKELTACAANFGGKVQFLPTNAWKAGTTGSGACSKEKAGHCRCDLKGNPRQFTVFPGVFGAFWADFRVAKWRQQDAGLDLQGAAMLC